LTAAYSLMATIAKYTGYRANIMNLKHR